MFESLSQRLQKTVKNLSGRGRLTETNIKEALKEIRFALLEADVALPVVIQFIEQIKEKAVGTEVLQSLRPGEALIKVVHDELVTTLGSDQATLNFKTTPPVVILLAGLQGAGKTTTVAKLAAYLKRQKKSVLVASTDIYRPAAIQQLETLAQAVAVDFFPSTTSDNPVKIAEQAIKQAKKKMIDVVIIDSAGRLHIDDEMMTEIKNIHHAINPVETLFVVDSLTGQDAANTAKVFDEALPLTGIVLTKIDGDARGGAALSTRFITGKPIKFIGTGEKTDALEPFYPERIASRILDKGDIVSLVEEVQQKVNKKQADKLAKKVKKGKGFDLQDFADQIEQISKMGGIAGIMGKLPGMGQIPKAMKSQVNDDRLKKMRVMIQSMTLQERQHPSIIKGTRKQRILKGSGTQVQDLNKLLKQFLQMQKMMKKVSKGGSVKMMRQMQQMMSSNRMPPLG